MRSVVVVVLSLAVLFSCWSAVAATPPGGRLRGEIAEATRLAVPGATLIAVRRGAPAVLALTSSNARGHVALDALPEGIYDVYADAEGYLRGALKGLRVRAPYRAIADLTLVEGYRLGDALTLSSDGDESSGQLVARIVDEQGAPIAGVRVRFEPVEHRADPVALLTDEEGVARANAIPAGSWRLILFRAGFARLRVPRLNWPGGELSIVARMMPLPERTPVPLDTLLPAATLVE